MYNGSFLSRITAPCVGCTVSLTHHSKESEELLEESSVFGGELFQLRAQH